MKSKSLISLFIAFLIIGITHFFYYPKWNQTRTEATISWDVSGYYMYLPAIFIYKDIRQCSFRNEVLGKYHPTPDFQQAFRHNSGNYVMKYSIGQAVQYAPFFLLAHIWAKSSDKFPADGFSFPYQFLISMESILVALIGLLFLRRVLLIYFDRVSAGISLLILLLGTNYLNYSAIDGAMTHNYLFTIYSGLLYTTILFYRNPTRLKSLVIGLLVGLAALTRPSEIISALIPLLWGLHIFRRDEVIQRLQFFRKNSSLVFIAILACLAIGSMQLFYWKYASGEWLVYSYQDQGFSWLKPHLWQAFFSYKSGWLVYSPVMAFSLVGFYWLYRNHRRIFGASIIFFLLFIYIAFAWDIWWYGGSLGQRTMVQAYPVLMFPLCSFVQWSKDQIVLFKAVLVAAIALLCYMNLWFTHQAHRGGLLHAGEMTKEYYWKVLGRFEKNDEDLKLLDIDECYHGERKNVRLRYANDLTNANSGVCESFASEQTSKGLCINKEYQYSESFEFDTADDFDWIRAKADFGIKQKEWDTWRMAQFIVKYLDEDDVVKAEMIRIYRLLNDNEEKTIFIDVKKPREVFDRISIVFWNADGDKEVLIKNLEVEVFDEGE